MKQEQKKSVLNKWWFWALMVIGLFILIGVLSPSDKSDQNIASTTQSDSPATTTASEEPKNEGQTSAQTAQTNNQNDEPVSNETTSQKNAVKKAKSYLDYSSFSHDGLIEQLEYEQFSHDDAVYGADNSNADWNEQAAKKAKSYMSYSSFSRGSLIEQLIYEKFTQEQAEYGANSVGL